MSTTVDQRVVEMRFDNQHFEKNVSNTMSTLDKLKQKLNLTGASKGLENVNAAAGKVNMSGLGNAVETVRMKFSALEVMGVTALANITNSAVNAGKRMVSALTIDPVMTGFSEYETKINSIQTIMSNTASKGTTMSDVTRVIDELNTYADKTIYNFAEMTRNIGTFTAAGVGLEQSAAAIKGIANLAAASGSTSQQASTAMYQLSQALAAGTVKLMDWNSVVNAGMGGEKFQEALKATAREHGVAVDKIIEKNGSFRDSLQEGWITADILNETLNKFTVDGATAYANSMKEAGKWTDEQAQALIKEAQSMEDAATKVKTFTQLMDTLKESLQSGWGKTWEIIFGNFEEAQEFFSGLSDKFSKIIDASSDARNNLLEGALGSKWNKFTKQINEAGVATDKFTEKLKEIAKGRGIKIDDLIKEYGSLEKVISSGRLPASLLVDTLKEFAGAGKEASKSTEDMNEKLKKFQKVVDQVWNGDFKNGEERVKALTDAGYDYAKVQDLVNKTVDGHKLTIEDLSDAQLENLGYTEDQIEAIRKLAAEAEKTGTPLNELIKDMSKPSGRELLIDSFYNVVKALEKPLKAVKDAWGEVFDGIDSDDLYGVIEKINEFTESLIISDETAERFKNIMAGIFDGFKLTGSIASKSVIGGIKILNAVLGLFSMDILDVAESIAKYISIFADWVEVHTMFGFDTAVEDIAKVLVAFGTGIRDCIKAFLELDEASGLVDGFANSVKEAFNDLAGLLDNFSVESIVSRIEGFFDSIESWIKDGHKFSDLGQYIIEGLQLGLTDGAKGAITTALEIAKSIFDAICDFFGIHSPSRLMMTVGGFIIAGLIIGLTGNMPVVWDTVKNLFNGIIDIIKNIDIGTIFAGVLGVGMIVFAKKVLDIMEMFAALPKGLGKMFSSFGGIADSIRDTFNAIEGVVKAKVWEVRSKAILNFAKAIAILAASVALLTFVDQDKLWSAVGAIAALAVVVGGLAMVAGKMSDIDFSLGKVAIGMIGISAAILILSFAMKQIASIDPSRTGDVLKTFAGLVVSLGVLIAVFGVFVNGPAAKNMDKVGKMIFKMGAALLILAFVTKIVSGFESKDIIKGIGFIASVSLLFGALIACSKLAGENASKAGGMLLKMSIAMGIMVGVVKLASMLDRSEVNRGLLVIAGVELLFAGVLAISRLGGKNAPKAGTMLLLMAGALAIVVMVVKMIAGISDEDIKRGLAVIAGLEILFGGLIWVSQYAGQHAAKAGIMLIMVAGALTILSVVMYILGQMDPKKAAKALGIIAVLEALFGGLMFLTKYTKDCTGTMMKMIIAIGMLSVAVIALSLIEPDKLYPAVAALGVLMGAFALMVGVTKFAKNTSQMHKTLLIMVGIVAALAGVVAALSLCDSTNSIKNTLALSALLIAFSTSIAILGKTGRISKTAMDALVPMLAIAAGLATILGLLSVAVTAGGGSDALIPSAVSLGILINAFATSIAILGKAGSISKSVSGALGSMIIVTAGLATILGLLAVLVTAGGGVDALLPSTIALSVLLNAFAASIVILDQARSISKSVTGALYNMLAIAAGLATILGLLSVAVTAGGGVEALIPSAIALSVLLNAFAAAIVVLSLSMGVTPMALSALPPMLLITAGLAAILGGLAVLASAGGGADALLPTAVSLSTLLIGLSVAIGILSLIGPIATASIPAMGALAIFIAGLAGVLLILGGLSQIPGFNMLIADGGETLALIGYALGNFVGSIVGGIGAGISSGLPEIGQNLSDFMTNASGFFEGLNVISMDSAKKAGVLSAAILALTAAEVISGLTSFFSLGEVSFAKLGSELSLFMINATPFITGLALITPEMVESTKALSGMILALTAANVIDGITSFLGFGDSSIGEFGAQLGQLGTDLNTFVTNLGTFDENKVATVTCAANAIKALAQAAQDIPNDGGWAGKIFGENSISTFGNKLPTLGTNLATFAANLGTFDDATVQTVSCASEAIKNMAQAADAIPNDGGWAAKIFGENSISTFGNKLPTLGTNLATFASNLGTFDDAKVATVGCAGKAIKALAEAASSIDGQSEWAKKLFGDNSLASFGSQIGSVGTNIKTFVTNLGTFGEGQIATVKSAVSAIKALSGLADADLKGAKKNLSGFGEELGTFASDLSTFCSDLPSGESTSKAIKNVRSVLSLIDDISGKDSKALADFSSNLKSIGSEGVDAFVNAFTSNTSLTTIKSAGVKMVEKIIEGVESKQNTFTTAVKNIAQSGADAAGEKTTSFQSAGGDLGDGLAIGINAKQTTVYWAGYALGQAAVKGEKDGQASHSPSKLTIQAGKWLGEGLIIGMEKMFGAVNHVGRDLGSGATTSISSAISRVSDMLDSDMDVQPTIRPVLDLSDVSSGVNTMSGMLSLTPSVGVMSNIRAINAMSNRSQNGGNDDVVSAINKLRKDLGNVGGTTYNVNGVTYDDGSNVSEAVKSLVRAARVERRI